MNPLQVLIDKQKMAAERETMLENKFVDQMQRANIEEFKARISNKGRSTTDLTYRNGAILITDISSDLPVPDLKRLSVLEYLLGEYTDA